MLDAFPLDDPSTIAEHEDSIFRLRQGRQKGCLVFSLRWYFVVVLYYLGAYLFNPSAITLQDCLRVMAEGLLPPISSVAFVGVTGVSAAWQLLEKTKSS